MSRSLSSLAVVFLLAACHDDCDDIIYPPPAPSAVEIEVEVYDPISGGVWQDVGVRIVQADQEWSGGTYVSPYIDAFAFTDPTGLVYFSPFAIASYEVGFVTDSSGRAVLGPEFDQDQASVLIEVWAPGFDAVYAEVPLGWRNPYRFVSVPFVAPTTL